MQQLQQPTEGFARSAKVQMPFMKASIRPVDLQDCATFRVPALLVLICQKLQVILRIDDLPRSKAANANSGFPLQKQSSMQKRL